MRHINSEAYHKKTDAFKAGENQAAQLSKPVALPDELKPAWDLWFDTHSCKRAINPSHKCAITFSRRTRKWIFKIHLPNFLIST